MNERQARSRLKKTQAYEQRSVGNVLSFKNVDKLAKKADKEADKEEEIKNLSKVDKDVTA